MSLRATLSSYWCAFQAQLFPLIEQDIGPVGERYQRFIAVLEFVRVEQFLPPASSRGRPLQDRAALARAFIAKAVFHLATTRELLERLANDRPLRRLCGWQSRRALPQRGDLLPRLCRVRVERPAESPARDPVTDMNPFLSASLISTPGKFGFCSHPE